MIRACLLADLPRGEALRLDPGTHTDLDVPVAVFHTDDGQVFAIDDTCSHQDASLAEGWLEGCAVECPLHASTFDLRTGAVDVPPAKRPVRTHAVTVVDGEVLLTMSIQAPNLPPALPTEALPTEALPTEAQPTEALS